MTLPQTKLLGFSLWLLLLCSFHSLNTSGHFVGHKVLQICHSPCWNEVHRTEQCSLFCVLNLTQEIYCPLPYHVASLLLVQWLKVSNRVGGTSVYFCVLNARLSFYFVKVSLNLDSTSPNISSSLNFVLLSTLAKHNSIYSSTHLLSIILFIPPTQK